MGAYRQPPQETKVFGLTFSFSGGELSNVRSAPCANLYHSSMQESQQAPASGNLRAALDRLEGLLADAGDPVPELGRLGDPARLDFLFRLELAAILRAGPGAELSPARLLAVAHAAATTGTLPLATAPALRRTLRRLGARLHDAGAWDPALPMWWSPLPAPSPAEELWQHAGRLEETLPGDRLAEAFAETPGAPRWLSLPSLVPDSLIQTVHEQLETAHLDGALDLERAGVGSDQRLSARRSDSVLYLSGRESELVTAAPAMATLAQWCLAHLADLLASSLRGAPYPPRTVMLARYPATSGGYHPHLDNPGGEDDNGRALTFVLYLNAPDKACAGGEIAVWPSHSSTPTAAPAAVLPAEGGSAVLFDARTIAHQVRPLAPGPARWAMILWLSDQVQTPPSPAVPEPSLTDLLLPIDAPPLVAEKVLLHDLEAGRITVHAAGSATPRVGIVCTVYRAGTGLDAWCEHHLTLGFDHLVLVFDHLADPREATDAKRLKARYPSERLSVWSGSPGGGQVEGVKIAAERWGAPGGGLENFARSGSACWAVAARQTLNAGVALEAARTDELGGAPLDWLLHLDADELFHLQGAGRGGATLDQHFSAATASGLRRLSYANHELLDGASHPRFKRNPQLAAALLGPAGWSMLVAHLEMAQTDPRPYFAGYFNGKTAVAVAHAAGAAGVHGWRLESEEDKRTRYLAGPCVLHCHFADAAAFRRKYLAAEAAGDPPDPPLFVPSPVEVTIFERIRAWRREGADEEALRRGLDQLHATMTTFTDGDVELLEAAGLIFEPEIERLLVSRAQG